MDVQHIPGTEAISTVFTFVNESIGIVNIFHVFPQIAPIITDLSTKFAYVSFVTSFGIFFNARIEVSRSSLWQKSKELEYNQENSNQSKLSAHQSILKELKDLATFYSVHTSLTNTFECSGSWQTNSLKNYQQRSSRFSYISIQVISSLKPVFFRHMTFKCMFCFTQGVTNFTLIAFRFKMLGFKMLHGFTVGRPGLVTDQTLSNPVS